MTKAKLQGRCPGPELIALARAGCLPPNSFHGCNRASQGLVVLGEVSCPMQFCALLFICTGICLDSLWGRNG